MASLWQRRPDLLPSLGVFTTACGWGVFWLPIRAFDAAGLHGGWATFSIYVVAVVLLLPYAFWRRRELAQGGLALAITGFFSGGTFAFYLDSLLLTDVVRALLLFYLAPVWSTLLQNLVLKEPITPRRLLVIALGIGGLIVILGFEQGFPLPRNLGDWLALAGGMMLAIASVRIRAQQHIGALEGTFAFFASGGLAALILALLPFPQMGTFPESKALLEALPWLLFILGVFVIPATYLIIYGSRRLSPSRLSILLMAEALTGVISAAILTEEPFGLREAAGAVLIGAAGVVEVMRRQPPLAQPT